MIFLFLFMALPSPLFFSPWPQILDVMHVYEYEYERESCLEICGGDKCFENGALILWYYKIAGYIYISCQMYKAIQKSILGAV